MEKNKLSNKKAKMTKEEIEFFAKKPVKTVKKRTPIKPTQLKYLVVDVRAICNDYINKKQLSVHAFAKMCGVHPNQMYMFLNNERGLNLTTVQKIGDLIN